MIDLDRFARELTKGQSDEERHTVTKENKRPVKGIEEDPLIPWIRVAIMGLVFMAVGIVIHLVLQLG